MNIYRLLWTDCDCLRVYVEMRPQLLPGDVIVSTSSGDQVRRQSRSHRDVLLAPSQRTCHSPSARSSTSEMTALRQSADPPHGTAYSRQTSSGGGGLTAGQQLPPALAVVRPTMSHEADQRRPAGPVKNHQSESWSHQQTTLL